MPLSWFNLILRCCLFFKNPAILGLDLVYYSVARFVGFKPYLGDSFLALTHEALLCHLLRRLEKAKPRITEIICLTNMTT